MTCPASFAGLVRWLVVISVVPPVPRVARCIEGANGKHSPRTDLFSDSLKEKTWRLSSNVERLLANERLGIDDATNRPIISAVNVAPNHAYVYHHPIPNLPPIHSVHFGFCLCFPWACPCKSPPIFQCTRRRCDYSARQRCNQCRYAANMVWRSACSRYIRSRSMVRGGRSAA